MRLFRVVHESSRTNPLTAYKAPARYHLTAEEAGQTSYLAPSASTCVAEVSHHLGGTVKLRNMIVFEFDVTLERVLDLTEKKQAKRYGVTVESLTSDDHSLPRDIARRARKDKVQALIVPSTRDPRGKTIVLFLENIDKKKAIRKVREEKIE